MDRAVSVHSGKLIWSGEHWINAIRQERAEFPSAWVSLFHTRYSPAGEGNAAQVIIHGNPAVNCIAIDDHGVGEFTRETFFARGSNFDPQAPIVKARFRREGNVSREPVWIIESDEFRLRASWTVTEPPVIADGSFRTGTEHYTVLFFTNKASVHLNDQPIDGHPYPRDIWQASIGGLRSSCVFALAETLVEFG